MCLLLAKKRVSKMEARQTIGDSEEFMWLYCIDLVSRKTIAFVTTFQPQAELPYRSRIYESKSFVPPAAVDEG